MKVVVAMDSFKGSITSLDASRFVKNGVLAVYKDAQVETVTMSDGGDGFLTSLVRSMNAITRTVSVVGPLGETVSAQYGLVPETNTAIVEISQAAGIDLVPEDKLVPVSTTTYGVGELIVDAINQGCKNFVVGLGGSATNDGGMGMLQALGFEFVDKKGKLLGLGGGYLKSIENIKTAKADSRLKECKFLVACDVDNPLFGAKGATQVYGPQKGATPSMVKDLEGGLVNLSNVVKRTLGKTVATVPGAGAAGGLGYAFAAFLNGKLEPGSKVVGDVVKLEDLIKACDVVVTGEGMIDGQSSHGKVPCSIAKLAKQYNKLVVALAGTVEDDIGACLDAGIDAIFCVQRKPLPLSEAMNTLAVSNNISATTTQVFRLIKSVLQVKFDKETIESSNKQATNDNVAPLDEKLSGDNAIFDGINPQKSLNVDIDKLGDNALKNL